MKRIVCVIILLMAASNLADAQLINDSKHSIYLIKSNWHTGILIKLDLTTINSLEAANDFKGYKWIDIGWGDEDFYQNSGNFDLLLGSKAILIPTSSVIRIAGYNSSIEAIIKWSDYCIEFEIDNNELQNLLAFISNSFFVHEGNLIQASARAEGGIRFYKSNRKYHLFNTCNKWAAEVLKSAGIGVTSTYIITADDLFYEASEYGIVLKKEK
ncbi:MAG: DUF2459 domain-containing protein [Bacteroidetes bacterium]|nr:DUF2459 domain-containing protein [Bacteroidota bacterium]MBU1680409.1 DUF2459 domain-containing protein [Bacteroidota bacterium]MBU2507380.1 DUF2459 domain-containing protein [Bacteroidota bacterium]